ncbi:MAG: SpaA isopeptide-forming pilin-related protein [Anaerovoracaceae bacterium]
MLICDKAEHVHTEECYPQEEAEDDVAEDEVAEGDAEAADENADEAVVEETGEEVAGEEATAEEDAQEDVDTVEDAEAAEEDADTAEETEAAEEEEDSDLVAMEPAVEYICGKEEHTHGEECWDEEGNLICGLEEHVHDETCLPEADDEEAEEEPVVAKVLTAEGSDYTVEVTYTDEAQIPDDAVLSVREIEQGTEEYESYYQQAVEAVQGGDTSSLAFARFFDISFVVDGTEIEPAAAVAVKISYKDAVEVPEGSEVKSVHFGEETEVLDVQTNGADGTVEEVEFDANGFSVYGIVGTELVTEWTISNPDGEDVTYLVTVTYGPGAEIPEGSTLQVEDYPVGSEKFNEAKEQLIGSELQDEDGGWFHPEIFEEDYEQPEVSEEDNGLAVFDISIIDPEGSEIEPKAPVSVKIEMKELPEDTDKQVLENSMELKHFVETEDIQTIENVANTNNTYGISGGEISVSENNVTAEFDIESFSLFVFTWDTRNANIIVHYIDEAGNDLVGAQESDITGRDNTEYYFSTYEGGISGYKFKEAYIYNLSGEKEIVTSFKTGGNKSDTLTFSNGSTTGSSYKTPFNVDVYLVYEKNDYPSGGDGGSGSMDAPRTEKLLEQTKDENGNYDGTYTISLSVTGQQQSTPVNTKANVIVIYDSSNSMSDSKTSYVYTEAQYGKYGLVNGQYLELYYKTWYYGYEKVEDNDNHSTVYTRSGNYPNYTYTLYEGDKRYTRTTVTQTRDEIAKDAVTSLATALLANNTTANPDMVELAFIDFGSIVNSVNGGQFTLDGSALTTKVGKTSSLSTFLGWLNGVVIPDTSNSVDNSLGGTDWEEALKVANLYNFNDNDPVYIVFVSDGIPTYRISKNGHDDDSVKLTNNGRTVTVYGSGSGDKNNYNLDAAVTEAKNILSANKKLYTVGAFIDSGTKMQQLGGFFYDASEKEDLEVAFNDIVSSITRSLTYANVEITDGITDMTATTFVAGDPGNFKYYKDGVEWTADEMVAEGASGATTTIDENGNKQVVWNLGANYKLEKNVKYTLTFTVWPKQEAYDLLAALNNGILEWGDNFSYTKADGSTAIITYAEYKDQIIQSGSTYTVMTNTDAGITYQVVSEDDGVETGRTDGSAPIVNPTNGMGLSESHLDVRKDWNDSLDPQQLLTLLDDNSNYSVVLHIKNDNNEYVSVTIKPVVTYGEDGKAISATWPTEKVYIAPGIMLSEDKAIEKGINTDNYKKVAYNGTTYVILESGHDYSIDEQDTDYHFELRAETYHPMVVNGTVCNVSFTYDDTGAINGITAIDTTNTGTIVATNELRAGINLRKIVVDSEGEEIYPENEYFYLQVSLKDKNGNSILFEDYQDSEKDAPLQDSTYITNDGEESTVRVGLNTYPIWYNIYYDAYDDLDTVGTHISEGSQYYQRSDGMVVQDGGIIRIKAGDVIRFANVPIGTQFSLKEINVPAGYGFSEYNYKEGKSSTEWITVADINTGYGATAIANQSYYFTFTNEQLTSDVLIIKTDENGNAITTHTDTAIFKLTKNTKSDGTGTWENATATSGVATDGTVTINTTQGINLVELKDGLYQLQENKSPDGYIINSRPVYFKLNGSSIQFVNVEGSGSSTVVTEIETPDGYTIVEKTDTTPVTLKVANTPGKALPNTGGPGTLLYTLSGLALILASALMYGFGSRRRRERRLR